jgi:hypothetical protein
MKELPGNHDKPLDPKAKQIVQREGALFRQRADELRRDVELDTLVNGRGWIFKRDRHATKLREAQWEEDLAQKVEDRAKQLLMQLRETKTNPVAQTLFTDAKQRAVRIDRMDIAHAVDVVWSTPAENRFDRYSPKTRSEHSDPPLARMIETVSLAVTDPDGKPHETVISGTDKNFMFEGTHPKHASTADVRDAYLLLGLAQQIDFIPEIPQPGRKNQEQTVEMAHELPDYGVNVVFSMHSASRGYLSHTTLREDFPSRVVLKAQKSPDNS